MTRMLTLPAQLACVLGTLVGTLSAAMADEQTYDADLARSVGADERGMKGYVLVVLKTGPNRVPAGAERDEMFKGHFENIGRLANEGKLVLAGTL